MFFFLFILPCYCCKKIVDVGEINESINQSINQSMVEGLEEYSYSDRLRILGLTTLETRFLRADLTEVFKILKGFENVDPEKFFQVVGDDGRRGHIFKLFKRRCRMQIGCVVSDSSLRIRCARSGTGWVMM